MGRFALCISRVVGWLRSFPGFCAQLKLKQSPFRECDIVCQGKCPPGTMTLPACSWATCRTTPGKETSRDSSTNTDVSGTSSSKMENTDSALCEKLKEVVENVL